MAKKKLSTFASHGKHCQDCKHAYDYHEKDIKGEYFMCKCRFSPIVVSCVTTSAQTSKNMEKNKQVYFNTPQRLTQLIGANTTVIVGGRRTGKTDSIAAPFVLRNMQRMPGSTGGIVGSPSMGIL